MIPDRLIEEGTLRTDGARASVEVRIPWYRALPASCISEASLTIDGVAAPAESLRWSLNGRDFTFAELSGDTDDWWFPLDSAVLSGDVAVSPDNKDHEVDVELKVYIPYIIIDDDQVLRIEERNHKVMKAEKL